MNVETVFSICNLLAMIGWLILILLPFWQSSDKIVIGVVVTILALVYAWLIVSEFKPADFSKFGSLPGVMELFTHPPVVLAGWVHYLAFDLMVGVFIKKNSFRYGISHWLMVPCYILTFMLGPVGLLLYLLIRWIYTRQYFAGG